MNYHELLALFLSNRVPDGIDAPEESATSSPTAVVPLAKATVPSDVA